MILCLQKGLVYIWRWHFVLAVLDPKVGHTMDVLSPFISVLCHSDWLFHGESCPRLDVIHPSRVWSSSSACILHSLFVAVTYGKVSLLLWKSLENSRNFFQLQLWPHLCIKWGHVSPSREQLRTIFRSTVKDQGYPVCCRCARPYLEGGSSDDTFRTHYCSNFLQVHRPTY